jgi:serine/threonine protein kinase
MDFVRSDEYEPCKHRHDLVSVHLLSRPKSDCTTQIVDVACGLQYLHGQGIAHGDLHGVRLYFCIKNKSSYLHRIG